MNTDTGSLEKLSPLVARVIQGHAVWEPMGFRVTDFRAVRKEIPRQLLELARSSKDAGSVRASEAMSGPVTGEDIALECARVLRALCSSLLVIPAKAPAQVCPILNVEEISIPDAITHYRAGISGRLGPPILYAPNYPDWELAASCFALALEAEYRGPLYLGTHRPSNARDLSLGIWNFDVDTSRLITEWRAYVAFCEKNEWTRDRALELTPPGLLT